VADLKLGGEKRLPLGGGKILNENSQQRGGLRIHIKRDRGYY